MPLPDSATIDAINRYRRSENELANLWEILIEEDLVEEAQEYLKNH